MAQPRKTLLIVSIDRKVNVFLQTIINNIIGSKVRVISQVSDECASRPLQADVIMSSGVFLVPHLRSVYRDTPIVAPRRLITGYNLEKVLMLPRGGRVLVVNHPRASTEETIESLKELGITHLEYVPYWKGCRRDFSAFGAAISPGMSHLCPREIPRVIDIGPRTISLHSFLELLIALDLDLGYLEDFATYYHNFLLESSRKLAGVLEQSEIQRSIQEIIINQFDAALIAARGSGKVDIANRAAARLFKKDIEHILDENVSGLLSGFRHTVNMKAETGGSARSSSIYDYDGKQVLVQRIPVETEYPARFIYTFREIARIQRLEKDVRIRLAQKGHVIKYRFDDLWTGSGVMKDLKEKALNFAATEKNILIVGESGTGKELFAHAIHASSPRREGPFVAVNFAAIPEGLIESELFGYETGAFTGAKKGGKTGFFEQAHGGTIFLDEIGDAPLNVQSRLLRVLQEKEILKVGSSRITPVDVRIVAGTNRDLLEAMREKKFRNDLYYRLNTLPLEIPPLRERREDVQLILERYLMERYGFRKDFSHAAAECLRHYDWPGNVRELINLAEYVCISSRGADVVDLEHLPRSVSEAFSKRRDAARESQRDACRRTLESLHDGPVPLESMVCLLEVLRERKGRLNGRMSLVEDMRQHGRPIGEGRMKSCLRVLKSAGLIVVGSTKQGTAISSRGEEFLDAHPLESGLLG
ncbi:MAG: sigma 54-interacting transcriptional regulator [Syntrophobacteraceae bacterium]|nr:sigma 54-interacting transcriptional regulator [Desulfobacteraceae bacterium]